MRTPRTYGLLAEFGTPTDLIRAAEAAHREGYRRMEAYSPFPIHELPEAVGHPHTRLPLAVFIGGLIGCLGGYYLQYWAAAQNYPMNVGGRPYNSWPMFIPVTFEMTVLVASLTAVLGMLARNGLPRPHHPLFNVEQFNRATRDGFFLSIQALDPNFNLQDTRRFLESLGAREIVEVPLD
jgi:hypothetical protein